MSLEAQWNYQTLMANLRAENIVFLDEFFFNKTTGWRLTSWTLIENVTRYIGDRNRGHSESLLAAYTTQGYLPCWTVKKGYFNLKAFYE